jgi:hypothetical protein
MKIIIDSKSNEASRIKRKQQNTVLNPAEQNLHICLWTAQQLHLAKSEKHQITTPKCVPEQATKQSTRLFAE